MNSTQKLGILMGKLNFLSSTGSTKVESVKNKSLISQKSRRCTYFPSTTSLAFLAEMTANFQYIVGPLNAATDAMSRPP